MCAVALLALAARGGEKLVTLVLGFGVPVLAVALGLDDAQRLGFVMLAAIACLAGDLGWRDTLAAVVVPLVKDLHHPLKFPPTGGQ